MLTPRKRIRKKDLKEDKLVTFYVSARAWVDDHFQTLLLSLIGVLVVLGGLAAYAYLQSKYERTASVEFSKASRLFQASDYRGAATQFSTIVSKYGRTRSGKLARFYLAQSLFQTGDYQTARKHFKKAASALSGDPQLKAAALGGEAACLEQLGNWRQAAEKYEALANKYKSQPRAPYFLLRAARCRQQLGDTAKAQTLFQRLINDYPDSREKEDAMLLSALK